MQKRYQIFVSSTYEDLKEERSRVITALLNIGHIPCGMEYFPAGNEAAWESIERLIPQCDYYVVLVAGKYGSIAPQDTKSYTHREYELAVKHGIPVLGLLHKEPAKLPAEKCENSPSMRKKLDGFRKLVQRKLCRYWTTPGEIPGELLASLSHQINHFPRTGWVRADAVASDDAKNEIITLRRQLDKAAQKIEQFNKRQIEEERELSSGEDLLRIVSLFTSNLHPRSFRAKPEIVFDGDFCIDTTWNQLLRFLAVKRIERWATDELHREFCDEVANAAKNMKLFRRWPAVHPLIPISEIHKIEVQLSALGLALMKNDQWTLSQKGLVAAHRLLALRKGEIRALEMSWLQINKAAGTKINCRTLPATEVSEAW